MSKRVFLIVLDSVGIGEMPDSHRWHDEGSNTLQAIRGSEFFNCPTLEKLGLFNVEGVCGGVKNPLASFARMNELSNGKDTTVGHWEIAGLVSKNPLPTFPNGFPTEIVEKFEIAVGRKVLCNKPYSGTDVIKDYGEEHIKTGNLIVYTSADSVFQIAAHEDVVPVEELYSICKTARKILTGEYAVGRVIARPFKGEHPFVRTSNRHDFSLAPFADTMLDLLSKSGFETISVGKINDIFAGKGITKAFHTKNNSDGMRVTNEISQTEFEGLCFVNLVEFDSAYGHRNDVDGYAKALSQFDRELEAFINNLRDDDLLIITADHGCDPSTPSTDHSREYTPMLIYGNKIASGVDLKTRASFSDISATILEYFSVDAENTAGKSFLKDVLRGN